MKPTDIDLDFLVKGIEVPTPESDRINGYLPKDRQLTDDERAMAHEALTMQMIDALRAIFARARRAEGLSYKDIACRLGVDPAVITRRFQGGQNMSLKTIAEMLAAIDGEVEITGHYMGGLHPADETTSIETATGVLQERLLAVGDAALYRAADLYMPVLCTRTALSGAWVQLAATLVRPEETIPHPSRPMPLRAAGIAPITHVPGTNDVEDDYVVNA